MEKFRGLTALVTGASSGLGEEFASQLATHGANLVLLARRESELNRVADKIRKQTGCETCQITVLVQDLNQSGAVQRVVEKLSEQELSIDILINNAGFGLFGNFIDVPIGKTMSMLNLDMLVLTELTHLLVDKMKNHNKGYILNVASIGAFQATPTYAAYSAAKAYVLLFSEALNYELKEHTINVSTLLPGITATEFLKVSGQKATLYQRLVMMKAEKVVSIGLTALGKNTASVVPGLLNKLTVWSNRLVPRFLQTKIAYLLMRN